MQTISNLKSINPPNLQNTNKEYIKQYFENTYQMYETLFKSIKPEHMYKIADPLRRPLVFYLGHTSVVYMMKFILAKWTGPLNEWFEKLFATGVDPIYREELDNELYHPHWPDLDSIWNYRKQVFDKTLELIENTPLTLPIDDQGVWYSLLMGIEHERIHFETTTVLLHQLETDYLTRPEGWNYAPFNVSKAKNEFIKAKGGKVVLGKERNFPTFGWDNEYGKMSVDVNDFEATKFLITNEQFLEFVMDKGYEREELWTSEGKEWKNIYKASYPLFWTKITIDDQVTYRYRAMYDVIDMPLDWPVECNYHEAKAYMNWLNLRDPRYTHRFINEKEWHIARGEETIRNGLELSGPSDVQNDIGAYYNNNNEKKIGNLNMLYGSCSPVDLFPPSPQGFYDTYGNVWEYTDDYFRAFPGFAPHYLYLDYSAPCFDFNHTLILGGAWCSTGLSASSYCRLGFRRHFYQHAGFRVVRELNIDSIDNTNMYEQRKCVGEYISSFYYENEQQFFNVNLGNKLENSCGLSTVLGGFNYIFENDYGMRLALEAISAYKKVNPNVTSGDNLSAFDLGCGIGKTAFYLSTFFGNVTGLDYSRKFIEICQVLQQKGYYDYEILSNGDNFKPAKAVIPDIIDRSRVNFMVGDAMNLPHLLGPFDIIVAANLIDRLTNPAECLINIRNKLKTGGVFVLTSPYTWLEQFTNKENWIGGKNGVSTFEALKELMSYFCMELVEEKSLVLVIREHERKYQLIFPHMTVWRKTSFNEEFATSIFKNKN
jgi:5-histidylcysteine sulfoxide synthase/putative 4-mercaptohistidine N1-methyltranferase